jgi:hypothetical protein
MTVFEMAITVLAIWRLSHMLRSESGPWDVFIRIREKLGDSMPGRAMDCCACSSIWLSPIVFVPLIVRILLALSALAMFTEKIYGMRLRGIAEE